MILSIIEIVFLQISFSGVVLSSFHPMMVAVLYFSMSPRNPFGEV